VLSCMMVVVFVVVFLTRLRISYMESGAPKQKRGKKWKM